jgi:hypothetical protein
MRRFMVDPPTAATTNAAAMPAATAPVVVQVRSHKPKKLDIEDFKGMPGWPRCCRRCNAKPCSGASPGHRWSCTTVPQPT